MPLRLVETSGERLTCRAVTSALTDALDVGGEATLLVPSRPIALRAELELSADPILSMGVTVDVPGSWAIDRARLYGPDATIVTDAQRSILMDTLLADTPDAEHGGLDHGPGTLRLLCRLAKGYLPWVTPPLAASVPDGLTSAQAQVISLVRRYADELGSRGLAEPCSRAAGLPLALAASRPLPPAVVLAGFSSMTKAVRDLVVSVAMAGSAEVVIQAGVGPAWHQAASLVATLTSEARAAGVDVTVERADERTSAAATVRVPELESLRSSIFRAGEEGVAPLVPAGAVSLIEAAGPSAEASAVAERVRTLLSSGAGHVVVMVPDVRAAWRDLGPKLSDEAEVRARVSVPVSSSAAATFLDFADVVAHLQELDGSWPAPVDGPGGPVPRLGDMGWWPPRAIVDFLLSSVSGVPAETAWALDAQWRGDRLLTPHMVLDVLRKPSRTSRAVAEATSDLLRGRIGSATRRLTNGMADGEGTAEAACALGSVFDAADALRTLGISSPDVPLATLVALVRSAVASASVSSRVAIGEGGAGLVELVSPMDVISMAPVCADALVCCSLTTASCPVSPHDDALTSLLDALGLEPVPSSLDEARASFMAAVSVPTSSLVLSRPTNDADSEPTYPSVMLSEVLAAYGLPADGSAPEPGTPALPVSRRGEDVICENLSTKGTLPPSSGTETSSPAGVLTGASRRYVVVPRNGEAELPEGRPSLSASQIESYLECPYKWFTLRRLRLQDCDAGFSAMETGTFAHRVLEVTHARLLAEAVRAREGSSFTDAQVAEIVAGDPVGRLPGSRVTPDDLAHARELLTAEFSEHLSHQYRKGHKPSDQALVPHSNTEGYLLERLAGDLASELDYETGVLAGFEPRFFELRFGGRSGARVTYAGADFVGSIDRVDVDGHGRAVVVDYKHKSPGAFVPEYSLWPGECDAFALPRRVQTLVYASVARATLPGLKVVGAVYLSTKGDHALAGAVDRDALDQVFPASLSDKARERMCVQSCAATPTFDSLLDQAEQAMASAVRHMMAGDIPARPVDAHACEWCPVLRCERRLS